MRFKKYAKKYIVHRFQYRLLANTLVYIAAVVLVFVGVLFAPLMVALNSDALNSPAVQNAAHQFMTLHTRLWPAVILLAALLVVHTIIFSHRIAGPLERIRGELKKIGDGNLTVHVKVRKHDYLHEQVGSVNEMVEALRDKVRTIEESQERANVALIKLQRAVARGAGPEMTGEIEELGVVLERLRTSVGEFQIEHDAAGALASKAACSRAKTSDVSKRCEVPTNV